MRSTASAALWQRTKSGETGKPCWAIQRSVSLWAVKALPSTCCRLKTKMESPRSPVMDASFWRREPAAALRGFLKGFSPSSIWRSTSFSKLARGMYTSPRTSRKP